MPKRRTWEDDIKDMLRREHGAGWRLREQSGKAQLTQLLERDGQKRKSGDLGIEWTASNQTEIAVNSARPEGCLLASACRAAWTALDGLGKPC
jgi:hypothetical protein